MKFFLVLTGDRAVSVRDIEMTNKTVEQDFRRVHDYSIQVWALNRDSIL